jgi:hypothetical protein
MRLIIGLFFLSFTLNYSYSQEMKVSVGYQETAFSGEVNRGLVYYKMNAQGKPVLIRYSIPNVVDGEGKFSSNAKPQELFEFDRFDGYTHFIEVGCCGGTIFFKGWRY